MKNKLAKIYVTEMRKNRYLVYMAVDGYMYELGTYRYYKKDEGWEVKGSGWMTEGQAQRQMYRAMVIGMARIGETIAELTAGTLQEPMIWDVKGERTVCAVDIRLDGSSVDVEAPHSNWFVSIKPESMKNAHEAARELCLAGAPQWAAQYAMTIMRRWKKIMRQRELEQEVQDDEM